MINCIRGEIKFTLLHAKKRHEEQSILYYCHLGLDKNPGLTSASVKKMFF